VLRVRDGFTLFEAVVALMIIGVVAVSTLSAVGAQLRAQERAQRVAEVEALAQDRLSALELLTADELQSLPDSIARGRFPPPYTQYTWQAMSRPVLGEEYLNDVGVAITWNGGSSTIYSRIYQPPQLLTAQGGAP
jgi:prepilin-type N-terminal cleavage/methylation domain-containing protein